MRTGTVANRLQAWAAALGVLVLGTAGAAAASAVVTPNLVVTASPATRVGMQVYANANIMGGANPTGTMTFRLYPPTDPSCVGAPAFTSTVAVTGTSVNSERFSAPHAGTWRWTVAYGGDGANSPAGPTSCADPGAAVLVERARPVLSVSADPASGATITAAASLSGGYAPTGTITFILSPPGDTFCATEAFRSTVGVAGNGTYRSAPFTATIPGDYRWRALYSGDGDNVGVTVTACVDANALVTVPSGAVAAPGLFHAVTPSRILDTRLGIGAPAARVGPGGALDVQVTGRGGVPAGGVAAVVLNLTAADPTSADYLTVWPSGQPQPPTSSLNVAAGQTLANAVTVGVGADGRVSILNAAGSVDVIADVAGWYGDGTEAAGRRFHPLVPARILDTRTGLGGPAAPVGPGATLDVQVTGGGGVPASGVSAVVLTVVATQPTTAGYVTAWPAGQAAPAASSLNFTAGATVSNSVTVATGSGGRISLANAAGSTHLIADVAGWYGDGTDTGGARFSAVAPARIVDTRLGVGAPAGELASGSTLDVAVAGRGGVPATGAVAVVANVTVTDPAGAGYLAAWPAGAAPGPTAVLNFDGAETVGDQVVSGLGAGGQMSVYAGGGPTQLIVDVNGWFGP